MPAAERVRLTVYDMLSREGVVLLDGLKPAGVHAVEWQAGDLPSGIYGSYQGISRHECAKRTHLKRYDNISFDEEFFYSKVCFRYDRKRI